MKKFLCLLVCVAVCQFALAQKKLGLLEYITNSTAAIRANGVETNNGTGLFFLFNTKKGKVASLITSRTLVDHAQSLTFFLLGANKSGDPQYQKPEEITIKTSDLKIIHHPDPAVDLVLIPVSSILEYFASRKILISYHPISENVIPTDSIVNLLKPVENVLLIGYPAGIRKEAGNIPLVKQGITSTPAFIDYDGKKEVLVNIAPYAGAAGAPVFIYQNNNIDRNDLRMDGQRVLFLGIATAMYTKGFSERIGLGSNVPAEEICIVTKSRRIFEFRKILDGL